MHILDLLASAALTDPDQIAIEYYTPDLSLIERCSYQELSARAHEIETSLREAGVRRGSVVSLRLPKCPLWIAAMWGCWRAGAVILPLSPSQPTTRSLVILEDAQASVELSCDAQGSLIITHHMTCSQTDPDLGHQNEVERTPDDPAYLIYTSGSTGRPKGVRVSHQGLPLVLTQQVEAFGYTAQTRSLWLLSPQFDASLSDVGVSLVAGATLCIISEDEEYTHPLSGDLMSTLQHLQITHLDLPPASLSLYDPHDTPECLQHLTIGGEAAPVEVVRQWAKRLRLVNVYGPTEATICTSLVRCDPDTWRDHDIGQPLRGVRYLIVDDALSVLTPEQDLPLPSEREGESPPKRCVEGELLIGGETLAIGYQDVELTQERFVILNGERWYRTGDRVRHEEGRYLFRGRLDRQLKRSGALISPEEVEVILQAHSWVGAAAVLGVETSISRGQVSALYAILEFKDSPATDFLHQGGLLSTALITDLGSWMRRHLPEWMCPTHWRWTSELPRLSSHKINYEALRRKFHSEMSDSTTSPQDHEHMLEDDLLRLWRRCLDQPQLGLDADFFAEGGDSLALIDLTLSAQAQGILLSWPLIQRAPTPRQCAALLQEMKRHPQIMGGAKSVDELSKHVALKRAQGSGSTPHQAHSPYKEPQHLRDCYLVTGASGYLGAHLIERLVSLNAEARVIALVRSATHAEGITKLERALTTYQLHLAESDWVRVEVVLGDVSRARLGLEPPLWDRLAHSVTHIFHSAAVVHLTRLYDELAPTNVDGLMTILELQRSGPLKVLNYCSTLSVFVSTDQNQGLLFEEDDLLGVGRVYGGYAQSKWVAERILWERDDEHTPSRIFRLGLLTANSITHVSSTHDYLARFIAGLIELGGIPEGPRDQLRFDMTPVDYAAHAMVTLGTAQPQTLQGRRVYHIANSPGLSLDDMTLALREWGIALADLTSSEWTQLTQSIAGRAPTAQLTLMGLCRLDTPARFQAHRALDLFQATETRFDDQNTRADLQRLGSDVAPPTPSRNLFSLSLGGLRLSQPIVAWMRGLNTASEGDDFEAISSAWTGRSICVVGPESSGKTTLCAQLRRALDEPEHHGVPESLSAVISSKKGAIVVPEVARRYIEALSDLERCEAPALSPDDFRRIAEGQTRLEYVMRNEANMRGLGWIISDTCALMTQLWAQVLVDPSQETPDLSQWISRERFDLYLLLAPDLDWARDEVRYQPQEQARASFFQACEEALRKRDLSYVVIRGQGAARRATALEALAELEAGHVISPAGT